MIGAVRPTRAGVLTLAAAPPVALLLLAADQVLWPLAVFAQSVALLALLADAMAAPARRSVTASLRAAPHLYVGDTDVARLILTTDANGSRRCEISLEIEGPLTPPPSWAGPLPRAGALEITLPLRPTARGRARLAALWSRWTGPLGLIWVEDRRPVEQEVPVLPDIRAVTRRALGLRAPDAPIGQKPEARHGEGSEFEALKEYVQGMDYRAVDWKQSARHRKLVCKEFRAERNHPVVVAFDTGHLMSERLRGAPRLDRAINAGLLLAHEAAVTGDLVGCFAFDATPRAFVPPRPGLAGYRAVQGATVDLAYGTDETNHGLALTHLAQRLSRRTLVVLFTEFVDTVTAGLMVDALERLRHRHLVLCVTFDPPDLRAMVDRPPDDLEAVAEAAVADGLLRDRAVVLRRLERMGVHVLATDWRRAGVALIDRYLRFKRLDLA